MYRGKLPYFKGIDMGERLRLLTHFSIGRENGSMVKSKKKGLFLGLSLCVLLCVTLLWGCAGQEHDILETGEETMDRKMNFHSYETFEVENPDDVSLADMLQKSASGAMVQITSGARLGSGIILSMDEKWIVIATAAHVLDVAEETDVLFADGLRIKGDKSWTANGVDLGFVCVAADRILEEGLDQYCYAAVDREAYEGLRCGDGLIVMGSIDGVAANAYEGKIQEPWIYVEDFAQYMLTGKVYVKDGMSGGGVFDQQGHFIGILSGTNETDEIAAVPLNVILAQLQLFLEEMM